MGLIVCRQKVTRMDHVTFRELHGEVFLEVSKNNSYRLMSQIELPEAITLSSCSDNSRPAPGADAMVGISMVTALVGGQSLGATFEQTKDTSPSSSVICGKQSLLARPESFHNELHHHPEKALKLWIAWLSLALDSLAERNPTVCPENRGLLTWPHVREESYRAVCAPGVSRALGSCSHACSRPVQTIHTGE